MSSHMIKFNLQSVYDGRFDIIDLKIENDYKYDYSIEVDPSFIIDIDEDKRITGFEILDASKYFNLDPKLFYPAQYLIKIKVTVDVIKIRLVLFTSEGKFEYNDKIINNDNVIIGDYEYANGDS